MSEPASSYSVGDFVWVLEWRPPMGGYIDAIDPESGEFWISNAPKGVDVGDAGVSFGPVSPGELRPDPPGDLALRVCTACWTRSPEAMFSSCPHCGHQFHAGCLAVHPCGLGD